MNSAANGTPAFAVHDAIALDGDKLKPREDQRKGGNGFGINEEVAGYTLTGVDRHGVAYGIDQQGGKGGANSTEGVAPTVLSDSHGTPHGVAYGMDARNTGIYGAGATGEEVSMTQDANQCKGGKCVVQCYENNTLNHSDVCRTISGNHDDRVTDTGTSVVQIANGVSFDGRKEAPIAEGVAHSQTIGTNPGFKDGVVVSMAQNTRDEVRIVNGDGQIAGALPAEPGMKQQTYVVSTNSNGEDVTATINANMSKLGGDNQTTFGGGGTASPAERKERTMSHNFELYNNADEVSVSLSAKRVRDTLVVREKEGAEGE